MSFLDALLPYRFVLYLVLLAALVFNPKRYTSKSLLLIAFSLWAFGGVVMLSMAINRMAPTIALSGFNGSVIAACATVLIVGLGKGLFVLRKTAQKNIERLQTLTEPVKSLLVYSKKSWMMLALMAAMGVTINLFGQQWGLSPLWRGAINGGIGLALLSSSMFYWKAYKTA